VWTSTRTTATALDEADKLAGLRAQYNLPPGVIHLDGNSGGPLPRTTPARLRRFVEHRWVSGAMRPRVTNAWRPEARLAANALAPLIGADADEITVAESTSMNIFQALLAIARLRPDRSVLLVGRNCLSADRYLALSAAHFTGCELRLLDGPDDILAALDDNTAMIGLSHTDPITGGVRDLGAINDAAHRHGALTLWELSQSAGALNIDLHGCDADFAIGCGSMYLGGGPGSPAYSFLSRRHHADLARAACRSAGVLNPLANGFVGAPSMLSLSELRAGLSILEGVPTAALHAKTSGLVGLFLDRLHDECGTAFDIIAPLEGSPRGTQVSLRHRHALYLAHGLFARGVVADFIEPDTLRFSFAPSWLRYVDVWEAVEALREVLDELDR
jgi:kynureninase